MSLNRQLSALEAADLIRRAQAQPDLEYLFRHALVQDAVYGSLLRNNRRSLHQAVGELLEKEHAHGLAEHAALLAHHFDQAGNNERALHYLELAGDEAAARFALAESLAHYGHAWRLTSQMPGLLPARLTSLALRRGRVLELSGRSEDALAGYAELHTLGVQAGDRPTQLAALMAQAVLRATPTPTYDRAIGAELITRTLALAHATGDRAAEAKVLWISMVLVIYSGGDWEKAQEDGEHALGLLRALLNSPLPETELRGLRELEGFILHDLPFVYLYLGLPTRAEKALLEAVGLLNELGNLPLLAETLVFLCTMRLVEGRYTEALEWAAKSRAAGDAGHHEYSQSYGQMLTGRIAMDHGQFDAALSAMEEAIVIGERAGNFGFSLFTRADLGWGYAQLGAFEAGLSTVRRARAIADATTSHFGVMSRAVEVRLYLLAGERSAAQECITGLRAWYSDLPDLRSRLGAFMPAWAEVGLAEITFALANGEPQRALAVAEQYIAELQRGAARHFLPEALYLKGRAHLALDELDAAQTVLQAARDEAEFLGARRHLWPICAALADVAELRGDTSQACALRRQAQDHVEFMAAHAGAHRQTFLALPAVSALLNAT